MEGHRKEKLQGYQKHNREGLVKYVNTKRKGHYHHRRIEWNW